MTTRIARLLGHPVTALAALGLLIGAAQAQESARYVLKDDKDGGFMLLDRQSGGISHCRKRADSWLCQSVADDRKAYQEEIERLSNENSALQSEIADLESRLSELGAAPGGDLPGSDTPGDSQKETPLLERPSAEDVERLQGFFEDMMRRFREFARSLNEQPGKDI